MTKQQENEINNQTKIVDAKKPMHKSWHLEELTLNEKATSSSIMLIDKMCLMLNPVQANATYILK